MANVYNSVEKESKDDIKHYGVRTQIYTDPQTNQRMMRHNFAMANDPKGANKKAIELSRKALERFGETDPQKILDMGFSTFMNRTFMSLMAETPEDQQNADTTFNAYKKGKRFLCGRLYVRYDC